MYSNLPQAVSCSLSSCISVQLQGCTHDLLRAACAALLAAGCNMPGAQLHTQQTLACCRRAVTAPGGAARVRHACSPMRCRPHTSLAHKGHHMTMQRASVKCYGCPGRHAARLLLCERVAHISKVPQARGGAAVQAGSLPLAHCSYTGLSNHGATAWQVVGGTPRARQARDGSPAPDVWDT